MSTVLVITLSNNERYAINVVRASNNGYWVDCVMRYETDESDTITLTLDRRYIGYNPPLLFRYNQIAIVMWPDQEVVDAVKRVAYDLKVARSNLLTARKSDIFDPIIIPRSKVFDNLEKLKTLEKRR